MLSSVLIFVLSSALGSTLTARATEIPLSLYTDESCLTPSTSTPNITLGLNVCTVTTGLESFILPVTPCISGNVAVWGFIDNACANLGTGLWDISSTHCYASSSNGAIAAIMLTCDANADETEPSAATATTTVSVGPVANSYPTSTSTPSSSSGNDSTQNSNTSPWDNLKIGERVGIIVVASLVGLGVITYLVVRLVRNPPAQAEESRWEWADGTVTQNVRFLRRV